MHVTVTYNVNSYDFFFRPIFVEFPHLKQSLLDDFFAKKPTIQLPLLNPWLSKNVIPLRTSALEMDIAINNF